MHDSLPILKALADESRLRIIDLLLTHDLCVGALASRLDISKAAVSQHLQILRKAGLVKGEKRGYWTHYMVQRNVLHRIAGNLMKAANQEALKGKPDGCSPEHIKACHGETNDDPCVEGAQPNDRRR